MKPMPTLRRALFPLCLAFAASTAKPAAAANTSTCTDGSYGGTWYCGYGKYSYQFNTPATNQFFVIGTDFAVWTRWRTDGVYSRWTSLGGQVLHSYRADNFYMLDCDGPVVFVMGTDSRWYHNARGADGRWSGWVLGNTAACGETY